MIGKTFTNPLATYTNILIATSHVSVEEGSVGSKWSLAIAMAVDA